MKVKRLHLQNYGRFENLNIDFAPTAEKTGNVTVIVGNNGAGKSQILQALATSLSWFVNGLSNYDKEISVIKFEEHGFLESDEGQYIEQYQIMNNKDYSELELSFYDESIGMEILNTNSTRKEILVPASYGVQRTGFDELIKVYSKNFQKSKDISLPIVAYYPVNRGVISTPMDINKDSTTNQLTAYEDALKSSVSFETFFSWFREREDIENESFASSKAKVKDKEEDVADIFMRSLKETYIEKGKLEEFSSKEVQKLREAIRNFETNFEELLSRRLFSDKQLTVVRIAIEEFTDLTNPRIRRQGTPTMIVEKDGEELDVKQLSQGEKSLLALVGDIARRLALLNPSLDNPLEGEGVVMIDEVDLHLHPKWQHDLIDKFVKTFPNVQFILTTHSPHVISDRPDILVYALDDGELTQVPNIYGEDVNTVLTKVFDVPIRDPEAQADFDNVAELIYQKNFESAENYIIKLEKQMPENLELLRCRLHLTQAQLAAKKEG
ncbi:AAA family ATPase [Psychrobacter sp. Pi2-51]|uniref:AAA family ATPase n=1 Tax=Psychrobacter sp. Pi2-51 TaxID=2774132 RepID=UPI001918826B|nr:AAA family ATPase [Psychrobacter sp. Pi2-51]